MNNEGFICSLCDTYFDNHVNPILLNNCEHKICLSCHELTINHENCNHFFCPICNTPIIFNQILSEPNQILNIRRTNTRDDLIIGNIIIFDNPVESNDKPLTIEEKYLIYQDLFFKNFYTLPINIDDIENDKYYVFLNKSNVFYNTILIGKISRIINYVTFDLFNPIYIARNSGYIWKCFQNQNMLKRLRIENYNDYYIYECITKN